MSGAVVDVATRPVEVERVVPSRREVGGDPSPRSDRTIRVLLEVGGGALARELRSGFRRSPLPFELREGDGSTLPLLSGTFDVAVVGGAMWERATAAVARGARREPPALVRFDRRPEGTDAAGPRMYGAGAESDEFRELLRRVVEAFAKRQRVMAVRRSREQLARRAVRTPTSRSGW